MAQNVSDKDGIALFYIHQSNRKWQLNWKEV